MEKYPRIVCLYCVTLGLGKVNISMCHIRLRKSLILVGVTLGLGKVNISR